MEPNDIFNSRGIQEERNVVIRLPIAAMSYPRRTDLSTVGLTSERKLFSPSKQAAQPINIDNFSPHM